MRRARIIEQAIGLFGERGYYGFTIQELAKRCELSNPGLLHYFPSKLDVLLGVLAELETREAEFMEPLVQQVRDDAGSKEAVLTVLRAMVGRVTAQPAKMRVMVEFQAESIDAEHPAHAWWHRREQVLLEFLGWLLAPHVDRPGAVARQLMALLDGFPLQWLRRDASGDALAEWDEAMARALPELHCGTQV